MLAEVDVLEQDEVSDDWCLSGQELPTIFQIVAEFAQPIKGRLRDLRKVVPRDERHLCVLDDDIVADDLELVGPCSLLRVRAAEGCGHELCGDVLVNGVRLRDPVLAVDQVWQVTERHEGVLF